VLVHPQGGSGKEIAAEHRLIGTLLLQADGAPSRNCKTGVALANGNPPEKFRRMRFPVTRKRRTGNDAVTRRAKVLRITGKALGQLKLLRCSTC
jgi:hypothetical protein